jgi:hypothetical protein
LERPRLANALTNCIERALPRAKRTRSIAAREASATVRVTVPSSTRAHVAKSERQLDAAFIDLAPAKNMRTRTGGIEIKFRVVAKRARPARPAASTIVRVTVRDSMRAHRSPRASSNAPPRPSRRHDEEDAMEINFHAREASAARATSGEHDRSRDGAPARRARASLRTSTNAMPRASISPR